MSDLIHHPEEARIVYNDDRPVELATSDGRTMYLRLGDLLDDQFDSLDIAVIAVSPDEEYSDFVEGDDE